MLPGRKTLDGKLQECSLLSSGQPRRWKQLFPGIISPLSPNTSFYEIRQQNLEHSAAAGAPRAAAISGLATHPIRRTTFRSSPAPLAPALGHASQPCFCTAARPTTPQGYSMRARAAAAPDVRACPVRLVDFKGNSRTSRPAVLTSRTVCLWSHRQALAPTCGPQGLVRPELMRAV